VADDEDPNGPDAVKKAIGRKRKVGPLTVIEGGKGEKPKRARKPKAKVSAESDGGFDPSAVPGAVGQEFDDVEPEDEDGDDFDGANFNGDFSGDDYDRRPDGYDDAIWEMAKHCAAYDQNDRDNARRLDIWSGGNIRYVPGLGWLTWRGTHWERDEGELHVRLMAQDLVDRIKLEPFFILATPAQQKLLDIAAKYAKIAEEDRSPGQVATIARADKVRSALSNKRSKRKNFAVTSGNAGRTTAMLVQATSLKKIDPKTLDADLYQFNVRNGTLHFSRTPDLEQDIDGPDVKIRYIGNIEFRPHSRDDFVTKMADVDYDPEAKCPRFQAFLDRMMPGDQMQRFLMVFHAYAMLIGGNGAQKVAYHFGLGGNGKTAFLETLGRLAGNYRTTVSPDTITGDSQRQGQQASPDIARLFNTRFVVVEELPKGASLREDLIKAFSGGTRLTARFLQKDIFEFLPIFVAILSGNTKPTIQGSDQGIWRRVLIVHWKQTIAEDDPSRMELPDLLAMFDEERSGILNWLIEGALLYLKSGLMTYVPAEVTAFTNAYRRDRDNIQVFCEAMIRPAKGKKVQAGPLYRSYTDWCEANGLRSASQRSFGDRLTELGYEKYSGRVYEYLDIELEANPKYDPPGSND